MTQSAPKPDLISPGVYQALAGLAVATIGLLRMQQFGVQRPEQIVVLALILGVGAVCVMIPERLNPILFVLALSAAYVADVRNRIAGADEVPPFFDLGDLLTCAAALTFVIAHHRLLSLRVGAFSDGIQPHKRSAKTIAQRELMSLLISVPVCVLAAQFACWALLQPAHMLDVDPRWNEFAVAAWVTALSLFVTGYAFRTWKRFQMDRTTARIMLQDILWHETRGEQRRIQRWLAFGSRESRVESREQSSTSL
jgi:hypothetical protein